VPTTSRRWAYAESKALDEFLALAYHQERGLDCVIVRLFNTVGPRQTGRYGMVLPRFLEAARRGQPIKVYGDGRQTRCFCYVGDTVEALVRLQRCSAARGEVINVGSAEEITIRQLAELVVQTVNSSSTIEHIPYDKAYAPGFEDMRRRRPVIDKLRTKTAFWPKTTLRRTIELTAAV